MASAETERMMALVAEKTGYDVAVTTEPDMKTWSDMVSASGSNPRHLIRINPRYDRLGDYLVALQCAMLVTKWADPSRISSFFVSQSRTRKTVQKVSKAKEVGNLPPAVRDQFCTMIVEGLLNQLQSLPTEMMAIEMCHELCPGLRGVQQEAVAANLREMTASLGPKIRTQTPPEIFRRNAAMNAAFCLSWAERSGDRTALIPFETLGFLEKGPALFAAYRSVPADSAARYVLVVDRWSEILEMQGWYEWRFRSEVKGRGSTAV